MKPNYKSLYKMPINEGSAFFKFVVSVLRIFVINRKVDRVSEGEEYIPERSSDPKKSSAIVIAPHMSDWDSLFATELVTRRGRMPRIFAKASLWKIPVVKQAFESGRLIPVERGTSHAKDSLGEAIKAIAEGDIVFIFPEGTISKDPESWPMTCKTGAARLALATGSKIIPIMQDGAQFLNKNNSRDVSWFSKMWSKELNRPLVHLKVYPPIHLDGSVDNLEDVEKANQKIENILTKIVEENRGAKAPARWNPKLKGRING
ncbi:MAG: 1-acyl-sn-glycerol-3-phosphate acyltransferase [Candidatus Ancillula sp.]|jgi:1-acyl-sn-glycerol-3-phosphate acyltransferase|nr:1-acyl-sn-glycerol-3-phosphate acyltransferase [Candidatus Ancillula sp.]